MFRQASFLVTILAFLGAGVGQRGSAVQQVPLAGQAAPPVPGTRASPQELVKLTARSDLVLVPVIVTDKSGKHVSGLGKEAFRVEEDGKVREISIFAGVRRVWGR